MAVLLGAVVLAGCGGGSKAPVAGGAKAPAARGPAGAAVVREWADTVRTGRFSRAAELFALPALISNGEPSPRKLTTRADVDAFNRSFPCGAVLLRTQASGGGRLLATFRLVDGAQGRDCGPGTGGQASVSFLVRNGHITEWVREGFGPPPGSTET